ncbi:MAG: hypothetical protein ACTTGX_04950, partial [Candidatus Cryptobacteroides sp.]
ILPLSSLREAPFRGFTGCYGKSRSRLTRLLKSQEEDWQRTQAADQSPPQNFLHFATEDIKPTHKKRKYST